MDLRKPKDDAKDDASPISSVTLDSQVEGVTRSQSIPMGNQKVLVRSQSIPFQAFASPAAEDLQVHFAGVFQYPVLQERFARVLKEKEIQERLHKCFDEQEEEDSVLQGDHTPAFQGDHFPSGSSGRAQRNQSNPGSNRSPNVSNQSNSMEFQEPPSSLSNQNQSTIKHTAAFGNSTKHSTKHMWQQPPPSVQDIGLRSTIKNTNSLIGQGSAVRRGVNGVGNRNAVNGVGKFAGVNGSGVNETTTTAVNKKLSCCVRGLSKLFSELCCCFVQKSGQNQMPKDAEKNRGVDGLVVVEELDRIEGLGYEKETQIVEREMQIVGREMQIVQDAEKTDGNQEKTDGNQKTSENRNAARNISGEKTHLNHRENNAEQDNRNNGVLVGVQDDERERKNGEKREDDQKREDDRQSKEKLNQKHEDDQQRGDALKRKNGEQPEDHRKIEDSDRKIIEGSDRKIEDTGRVIVKKETPKVRKLHRQRRKRDLLSGNEQTGFQLPGSQENIGGDADENSADRNIGRLSRR
jgi:hypothetical protein